MQEIIGNYVYKQAQKKNAELHRNLENHRTIVEKFNYLNWNFIASRCSDIIGF